MHAPAPALLHSHPCRSTQKASARPSGTPAKRRRSCSAPSHQSHAVISGSPGPSSGVTARARRAKTPGHWGDPACPCTAASQHRAAAVDAVVVEFLRAGAALAGLEQAKRWVGEPDRAVARHARRVGRLQPFALETLARKCARPAASLRVIARGPCAQGTRCASTASPLVKAVVSSNTSTAPSSRQPSTRRPATSLHTSVRCASHHTGPGLAWSYSVYRRTRLRYASRRRMRRPQAAAG